MKHTISILTGMAAMALLLSSCIKKQDTIDPHSPDAHYNQPPLGKDTVHATASIVDLDPFGYFDLTVTDDMDGKAYNLDLPSTYQDYGRCYLLNQHFMGPQTTIEKDTTVSNAFYVRIQHPNPVDLLEVELSDYNIKLTIGVKKVYVRITDATILYYNALSETKRSQLLRTDAAGRDQAVSVLEGQLLTLAGPDQDEGLDYHRVKPYFQRR